MATNIFAMQDNRISLPPHLNLPLLTKLALGLFLMMVCIATVTNQLYLLAIPFVLILGILPFYNLRLFYWIFALTVPLSAEIELPGGSLAISLPDEPIMMGMLLLVFFLILYNYRTFPEWFWKNSLLLIIFLQFIWLVVTVIMAREHLLSVKFLLAKCWFLASFLFLPILVVKKKADFKTLFLILAIPIILHSMVAATWHYFLFFGFAESNKVVLPFYHNHVDYGSILSMILPVVYIAFILSKGKRSLRYFLAGIMLFLCFATYIAFSRAAMLAVVFAFTVMFCIRKKMVNWLMPAFFTLIISAIAFLAIDNRYIDFSPDINKNATQKTFKETVAGAFTGEDMSSMERFYRWIASIRMSKERPVFGVGPNNWYEYYKPHAVSSFRTWVSRNEERSTTHNYFLLMLTEQGWPGMLLYAVLIIALFAKAQKVYHRFKSTTYKRYTLAVTGLIAAAFVNNFFSEFLETHKVGGLFYMAISLLIILDYKSKKEALNEPLPA